MTTSKIIARRRDGYGFLIGRLTGVVKRHGKRVYGIRTVSGAYLSLPAAQYTITGR